MKYPKMNPKIKQRWVKALRSNRYQKGAGALCVAPTKEGDNYSFCCLGVLTDLAVQAGIGEWNPDKLDYRDESKDAVPFVDPAGRHLGVLSEAVLRWAGIHDPGGDIQERLTAMNDGRTSFSTSRDKRRVGKRSHAAIADWIERNL